MLFRDLYTVMDKRQYCIIVNHYDDVYFEGNIGEIPDFIWDWIFNEKVTNIVYDYPAPIAWIRVDCKVRYSETSCTLKTPKWE